MGYFWVCLFHPMSAQSQIYCDRNRTGIIPCRGYFWKREKRRRFPNRLLLERPIIAGSIRLGSAIRKTMRHVKERLLRKPGRGAAGRKIGGRSCIQKYGKASDVWRRQRAAKDGFRLSFLHNWQGAERRGTELDYLFECARCDHAAVEA